MAESSRWEAAALELLLEALKLLLLMATLTLLFDLAPASTVLEMLLLMATLELPLLTDLPPASTGWRQVYQSAAAPGQRL